MIPILDLKAQYESIKDEINAAIAEVLESTRFILGPNVAAFEEEVAEQSIWASAMPWAWPRARMPFS